MRALKRAGEELQADVGRFQLFGQRGQLQVAAQALGFVDDEGDRDAGGPQFSGKVDRLVEFGPRRARVEIFSEKIRMTPTDRAESSWVSRDCRTVEARA